MSIEKTRVLLIEDDPGDARLVQEMLAGARWAAFELSRAASLSEGLERLEEGCFDVILLDLSLPDSNGPATFRKVRAMTSLPVLLLTGLEDEELGLSLLSAGAQDYLIKGRTDSELLARATLFARERCRVENALRAANAELDGFAHTVSHDLKGPLSAAATAAELIDAIRERPLTDDALANMDEAMGVITSSLSRARRLVDDLLAFAEAGQAARGVTEVDVGRTVAEVLVEMSGAVEEKGIRVSVDDGLGTIRASETQVYQVFSNSIGNAIKHNDSPEPAIAVCSLPGAEQAEHRYLVRDNGSGIPEADLENVFIPFFKGRRTGDTGMGLATVEKIVKACGGEIRAYNDDGACFEFSLRDAEAEK
jgi:signal transduction histidine kinase